MAEDSNMTPELENRLIESVAKLVANMETVVPLLAEIKKDLQGCRQRCLQEMGDLRGSVCLLREHKARQDGFREQCSTQVEMEDLKAQISQARGIWTQTWLPAVLGVLVGVLVGLLVQHLSGR
jgi:hypothetical protein